MAWYDDVANWWESNIYEPVYNAVSSVGTGLENWWYKLTGQTEKTSAYQAQIQRENELLARQEAREDSAYQRAVNDMQSAGLSKYGASPASSGSYHTGVSGVSDPIGELSNLQSLQSQALNIEERKHNLHLSQLLGIRTDDKNYAAKWAELGNVLFGFDPTKVEGGVIPYIFRLLSGQENDSSPSTSSSLDGSSSGRKKFIVHEADSSDIFHFPWEEKSLRNSLPFSEVLQGATWDQLNSVKKDMEKLQGMDDKLKVEMMDDIFNSLSPSHTQDTLKGLTGDNLSSAVSYGVRQMKLKGDTDDFSVGRLAEFLSRMYSVSEESVKKKIYSLL